MKTHIRIAKYLIVGASSVLVEYIIFVTLHYVFKLNIPIANVIGFSGGFIYSFFMNRGVVFTEGKDGSARKQIVIYLVLALFNLMISTLLVTYISRYIPAYITKILVSGFIAVYNYILYRKVIFK